MIDFHTTQNQFQSDNNARKQHLLLKNSIPSNISFTTDSSIQGGTSAINTPDSPKSINDVNQTSQFHPKAESPIQATTGSISNGTNNDIKMDFNSPSQQILLSAAIADLIPKLTSTLDPNLGLKIDPTSPEFIAMVSAAAVRYASMGINNGNQMDVNDNGNSNSGVNVNEYANLGNQNTNINSNDSSSYSTENSNSFHQTISQNTKNISSNMVESRINGTHSSFQSSPRSDSTSIPNVSNNKDFLPRQRAFRLNKFVRRLHGMLVTEKNKGIVEWRCGLLILHSTDDFAKKILPKYFNTRNFKTFRRQLNYYGFVHVRSFSRTGSTTTALWVNQELATKQAALTKDYDCDSISTVLLLKRVDPCPDAKTAEGRRVRKEEAVHTVEDIGMNSEWMNLTSKPGQTYLSRSHVSPLRIVSQTIKDTNIENVQQSQIHANLVPTTPNPSSNKYSFQISSSFQSVTKPVISRETDCFEQNNAPASQKLLQDQTLNLEDKATIVEIPFCYPDVNQQEHQATTNTQVTDDSDNDASVYPASYISQEQPKLKNVSSCNDAANLLLNLSRSERVSPIQLQ